MLPSDRIDFLKLSKCDADNGRASLRPVDHLGRYISCGEGTSHNNHKEGISNHFGHGLPLLSAMIRINIQSRTPDSGSNRRNSGETTAPRLTAAKVTSAKGVLQGCSIVLVNCEKSPQNPSRRANRRRK